MTGSEVRVGYVLANAETAFYVTSLRGFRVAMGARGIHALQIISKDGKLSGWAGCPNESPVSDRLAHFKSVSNIEVECDVSASKLSSSWT